MPEIYPRMLIISETTGGLDLPRWVLPPIDTTIIAIGYGGLEGTRLWGGMKVCVT